MHLCKSCKHPEVIQEYLKTPGVDVNETFRTPEEIIPVLEMISNSLDDDDGRLPLVNRLIRNYRQNRLTRADLDALRMFAPIIFRIRENEWWANGIAINKRSRRN